MGARKEECRRVWHTVVLKVLLSDLEEKDVSLDFRAEMIFVREI